MTTFLERKRRFWTPNLNFRLKNELISKEKRSSLSINFMFIYVVNTNVALDQNHLLNVYPELKRLPTPALSRARNISTKNFSDFKIAWTCQFKIN